MRWLIRLRGQAWCLVVTLIPALATVSAAPARIVNLGTLGGDSYASAINDSGTIVGWSYTGALPNPYEAFVYRGGTMTSLGTLSGYYSQANGINKSGVVVGAANTDSAFHAFVHSGGTMVDLGLPPACTESGASDVNNSGTIAGYAAGPFGPNRAYRFDGATMTDLGALGGTDSTALAINNGGTIVGWANTADGSTHAFAHSGTTMRDLGTLPGGSASEAHGINDAGTIVGWGNTAAGSTRAFKYTGTSLSELSTLGASETYARAVNLADVIVGSGTFSAGAQHAMLWQANGTAIDLEAWLNQADPLLGSYWTLTDANDINEGGLVVGSGNYDDGPGGSTDGIRAFTLDVSSLVPEPSAASVLAIATAVLSLRFRPMRRERKQVIVTSPSPP